jgi:uncharacterized membrane protein required for colicin V production
MIDFLLGIGLASLLVRGWVRGLVRELLDLLGLVLGVALAFRLSGPLGDFLADRFDLTPEWARIGAGIGLFVLVGAALAVAAFFLGRVARLPGLNLANRAAGAAFAGVWGLTLVLLIVALLRALPSPAAVDEALDGSRVVRALASPDSPTQRVFQGLAGDRVLDTVLALEPIFGTQRLVLDRDDRAEIEAAGAGEVLGEPEEAATVYRLLNEERVGAGLEPLAWSDGLAGAAEAHAREMYLSGYVSHVSPLTGTVVERVAGTGIRLGIVGENLALAADARAVHDGLVGSESHRANMLDPRFDRVGIAAVRGPLGLMMVEVFGG